MEKEGRALEKELYEPIKKYLETAFGQRFGNCHLEVTADGRFSEELKSAVRHDIIFNFLGKKASPDLTGCISSQHWPRWSQQVSQTDFDNVQDFITVEIKREKIELADIYQAKLYGDLFGAEYALLISPKKIPEEIKRLNRQLSICDRFMGEIVYLGEWDMSEKKVKEYRWVPHSPFKE